MLGVSDDLFASLCCEFLIPESKSIKGKKGHGEGRRDLSLLKERRDMERDLNLILLYKRDLSLNLR
jgi:hypothetical protein